MFSCWSPFLSLSLSTINREQPQEAGPLYPKARTTETRRIIAWLLSSFVLKRNSVHHWAKAKNLAGIRLLVSFRGLANNKLYLSQSFLGGCVRLFLVRFIDNLPCTALGLVFFVSDSRQDTSTSLLPGTCRNSLVFAVPKLSSSSVFPSLTCRHIAALYIHRPQVSS